MGNQCCLAVGEATVNEPARQLLPLQLPDTAPHTPCHPAQGDLDLVYAKSSPLKDLSSRMNIQQAIVSKRSSEASLLRLNNDLTNMINTFEKAHGTIGNELTRSKITHNSTKKISGLNEPVIDMLKKKRGDCQTEEAAVKGPPATLANQLALSVEEPEEAMECSQQSHSKAQVPPADTIQQSYSSSSGTCRDDYNSSGQPAEISKHLLDSELVDDEVWQLRQAHYRKSAIVEGNSIPVWQIFDTESFTLQIQSLTQEDLVVYAALGSISFYHDMFGITLAAYHRDLDGKVSVKLWVNGTKRCLELKGEVSPDAPAEDIFARALRQLYASNKIRKNPSYEVYHLSGWCPECLLMEEITNKDNLWDRLTENFLEGNILISFGSRREGKLESYYTLKNVNRVEGTLEILSPSGLPLPEIANQSNGLYLVEWSKLNPYLDRIYINWSPSIYSYNKKFDSGWYSNPSVSLQNQKVYVGNNPQFLIKIPKHEEDFEIRIFVDRHVDSFRTGQSIVLKLFEYDGVRVLDPRNSIRSFESAERELLSDVFIFEKSDEVDYFVLVVMRGEEEITEAEINFSILFLSFIEVEVSQLPLRETLLSRTCQSALRLDNVGMGISGPNFPRNLHYSLQVPLGCDIQLMAEATGSADFMLVLLEDPQRTEDLLRINFQTILAEDNSSDIFNSYGFMERQTRVECYLVVVACFGAEGPQKIKLTANVVSKLQKRNRELQECYGPVQLRQIQSRPNIIKTHPIKWVKENTGQRKRLKTTTTPIYHPVSVFAEFLKNPCVQLSLQRGRYQFNIVSEDYRKEFLSATAYEREEKLMEPPALSIAVLRLSDNDKGYKIILDDAFYVPIGYGFWSEELQLDEGRYTVICPRLNKEVGRGTLSIRQL